LSVAIAAFAISGVSGALAGLASVAGGCGARESVCALSESAAVWAVILVAFAAA
jgi:hypothetical protein